MREKQYIPIFVSSTYEDLKEYREEVQKVLIRMETVIKGMELFGSTPNTPLNECMKNLKESKVYIGIIAERYGSVDEETGKSYTQLEYEEAKRLGLPILIYFLDSNKQPILSKFVDQGEKYKKLIQFKEELSKKYTISFFTTPDDLGRKIALDLPNVLEDLGAQINRNNELQNFQDESLLKKFNLRPKKYEGSQTIIEVTFSKHLYSVDINTSDCLHIKAGDAVQIGITSLREREYFTLYAENEQADWLEDNKEMIEDDDIYRVKVKLLYGYKKSATWGSYDYIEKYEEEKGLLLIDIPTYVGKDSKE